MLIPVLATIFGLGLLAWSADWFIEGAAITARRIGAPPLLIGIIVVGFGTSAPEMVVSAFSAYQGNPGLALGNAYGSNIANIALILGLTALISPIAVNSGVLKKELPILCLVTVVAAVQLSDGRLTMNEAWTMGALLMVLLAWSAWEGMRTEGDGFGEEMDHELLAHDASLRKAVVMLVVGLVFLVISSRILVWGAVEIARGFGISDMIIGLTVVAFGTSLPELAASLMAIKKGEHDLIIGNILGSNLFNTLGVVGIATAIHPMDVPPEVMTRDLPVMAFLTLFIFVVGYGFRGPGTGRVNRYEGGVLLAIYLAYVGWLAVSVIR